MSADGEGMLRCRALFPVTQILIPLLHLDLRLHRANGQKQSQFSTEIDALGSASTLSKPPSFQAL